MFTSRAEFRLLLRHDNADLRLMDLGHQIGLLPDSAYQKMQNKKLRIEQLFKKTASTSIHPEKFNEYASSINTSPIQQMQPMKQLMRRPEVKLRNLMEVADMENGYSEDELIHVEFMTKYDGYLKRQQQLVEKFKKMEKQEIPIEIDYLSIPSLSAESQEKLNQIRPRSLGQASRISGVRHSDITVLMIYLEKLSKQKKSVSRETA